MMLSLPLRLLLAVLAIYRLANILARDDGPAFVFARLRSFTDKQRLKEQQQGIEWGPWSNIDEGVRCPFCLGIWLAGLTTLFLFYPSRPGDLFITLFGLAGGQAVLQERYADGF